jgi:hypothetical protein
MHVDGEQMARLVWVTSILNGSRAEYWVISRERTLSRCQAQLIVFLLPMVSMLYVNFNIKAFRKKDICISMAIQIYKKQVTEMTGAVQSQW